MVSIKLRSTVLVITVFALLAVGCSTAGDQLETGSAGELPFLDDESPSQGGAEQPVTEDIPGDEATASTIAFDPAVAGPTFDTSEDGPTLAVSGSDGVWWFDANGKAHLVVEPTMAADYDGAGGLVFQRSASSPIVRRSAEAVENDIVAPADGERVVLIGVGEVAAARVAIYLRVSEDSATLERAALDGTGGVAIADVLRDGQIPTRMTISGDYVTGVYLSGSGSGWTTFSTATGDKLFGTSSSQLGVCSEPAPGCATAVTVSEDGSTVYQVAIGDDNTSRLLLLNDSANFAALSEIDLQRPADGWHPTRIETVAGLVIISRSANADGTGDLPALVVDPASGDITQLERSGQAVAVTG